MKKLSIGVDLDGVVYDFWAVMGPWMIENGYVDETFLNVEPERWDFYAQLGLNQQQWFDLMTHALSEKRLWWNGPEMVGARDGLLDLVSAGHRIVLVTERALPGVEIASRIATYAWLVKRRIPHHALIIGPKRGLCLDIHIDDAPHIITQMKSENSLVVCYDHAYNRMFSDVPRVRTWLEFVAICNDLAEGRPRADVQAEWALDAS